MGPQQSSARSSNAPNNATAKTCYYEVLGVDRHATEDEIKKAYRKKALELHPDRNYGSAEDVTAKFADVSSAYEILSDPQERAWYDSHRESILRGDSGATEDDNFEHSVQLTSASNIVGLIGRFNSSVSFSDAPDGFYGILRETFRTLANEEEAAADWGNIQGLDYPDFGEAADSYEDTVRPFYRIWMSFATVKTFSWRDAYRTADAPDRATRRLVEKENKRLRDEGIREFNDAVRSLVAFARKRDPRYLPNFQSDADRQTILREAAASQAARSRAANRAKIDQHIVPEWAKTQKLDDEGAFSESDESVVEHIECVLCNKTFKSEKQYSAHEKSKKHIKAVQQIRREIRRDDKVLGLEKKATDADEAPLTKSIRELDLGADDSEDSPNHALDDDNLTIGRQPASEEEPEPIHAKSDPPENTHNPESSESDDEYAPRQEFENRIGISDEFRAKESSNSAEVSSSGLSEKTTRRKQGMAKAKREKKLAQQEKTNDGSDYKCVTCHTIFASKNKLFNHIKKVGHAQVEPKLVQTSNKKR